MAIRPFDGGPSLVATILVSRLNLVLPVAAIKRIHTDRRVPGALTPKPSSSQLFTFFHSRLTPTLIRRSMVGNGSTRTVDAHIVRLRQKVEPKPDDPRFILTVHGTGYKFVS